MILAHNEKNMFDDLFGLHSRHVDTSTALSHTLPTYWEKVLDINREVAGRQKVAAEDHTSGSTDKENNAN